MWVFRKTYPKFVVTFIFKVFQIRQRKFKNSEKLINSFDKRNVKWLCMKEFFFHEFQKTFSIFINTINFFSNFCSFAKYWNSDRLKLLSRSVCLKQQTKKKTKTNINNYVKKIQNKTQPCTIFFTLLLSSSCRSHGKKIKFCLRFCMEKHWWFCWDCWLCVKSSEKIVRWVNDWLQERCNNPMTSLRDKKVDYFVLFFFLFRFDSVSIMISENFNSWPLSFRLFDIPCTKQQRRAGRWANSSIPIRSVYIWPNIP